MHYSASNLLLLIVILLMFLNDLIKKINENMYKVTFSFFHSSLDSEWGRVQLPRTQWGLGVILCQATTADCQWTSLVGSLYCTEHLLNAYYVQSINLKLVACLNENFNVSLISGSSNSVL